MNFVDNSNRRGNKIHIIAILSLILLLLVSGCSNSNDAVNDDANKGKTVVDHMGRELVIPNNPERILALNSNMMESLFALGITPAGKVEDYKIREEGRSLPSVGMKKNINLEVIYEMKPDLIFAHKRLHGQIIKSLEDTGAQVFVLEPSELGDDPLLNVTIFMGKLLDLEDKAQEYVSAVNKIAEELKQKIENESEIKSAVIIQDSDTIRVAQNASAYGSLIQYLGINNIVPVDLPGVGKDSFVSFDIETIQEKDPDIMLILAVSKDKEENKNLIKKYKTDPQWANLTAVKKDRIKILPFKVHPGRSNPEDMLEATAKVILSTTK